MPLDITLEDLTVPEADQAVAAIQNLDISESVARILRQSICYGNKAYLHSISLPRLWNR